MMAETQMSSQKLLGALHRRLEGLDRVQQGESNRRETGEAGEDVLQVWVQTLELVWNVLENASLSVTSRLLQSGQPLLRSFRH
jgi:hypothetical protein